MDDKYFFEIPPSVYVMPADSSSFTRHKKRKPLPRSRAVGNDCTVGFEKGDDENWLLGDVFLRNYYSIWDNDRSQVGFGPHKTSHASIMTLPDMPYPPTTIKVIENYEDDVYEHSSFDYFLAISVIAVQIVAQTALVTGGVFVGLFFLLDYLGVWKSLLGGNSNIIFKMISQ
jgi:hypothetical protein